ncbi:MAG TPA: substrate-binding domain-containing protein [Planctomycetaceae bacterium]|nr:substrate-binding domain-containing protein [Planctomycetaceae bacterium]
MSNDNFSVNRVRERRVERSLTQAQLADRAGISRTAVTAIEGANLVPSVVTALSLAAALECTVEELFGQLPRKPELAAWAWEPTTNSNRFWNAEVFGRTLKYPAAATPMLTSLPDDSTDGLPAAASAKPSETLVIACCDPAAGLLASQFQAVTGMRLIVIPRSSIQAIELLRQGLVHLARLHLATAEHPDRNADVVRMELGSEYELLRLSQWHEGVALANSSRHRSVRSVLSAKLTWIGREEGSGARQCLDELLQGRRTPRCLAKNHQGVATAIQSGWADAGVCVQLVSEEAGLRFLPVQEEAYDVCYAKAFSGDRRLKAFINVVRSVAYRRLLSNLPGYDTTTTGCVAGDK